MDRTFNLPFKLLARTWALVRDIALVLEFCRFSLFVVAAGGALLLAVPQGRELTVRLSDEGAGKIVLFHLGVFLWAFQSWFWARFMLDAVFGPQREIARVLSHPRIARIGWLVDHLPRGIALLAYAVAVIACLLTQTGAAVLIGLGLLAEGVLFYRLLVVRRRLAQRLIERFPGAGARWLTRAEGGTARVGGGALLSRRIAEASLIAGGALFAWAWADPVGLGWFFGSSAVVFVGFSTIVPVGSLAVYWSRQGGGAYVHERASGPGATVRGYPVVTTLMLASIVFSFWVDNHAVRRIAGDPARAAPSVADAVDRWLAQAPRNADGSVSVVVVAAAGGGIRAAYWTATVLGAIQDRVGAFRRQLLGVSAVSGGSLGATVFVTLLSLPQPAALPPACGHESSDRHPGLSWSRNPYECLGQSVLAQDFLAPALAATLFTDLPQRFLPASLLPDRARALELAWERAWPRAGFGPDIWSRRRFDDLWPAQGHLPALLLNGTHVETGKRVITSNLRIGPSEFADAYDFFDLRPGAIRPSTAALNSARFTYVSPPGTLGAAGRVVDGGYFENFGADTARELLQAALARLAQAGVTARPVVILISNDPQLQDSELPAVGAADARSPAGPAPRAGSSWSNEALGPIRALLHTRDAHGILATHLLAAAAGPRGTLFHFRLCRDPGVSEPALGWVLSAQSERWMREQLRTPDCTNAARLDALAALLQRAGP